MSEDPSISATGPHPGADDYEGSYEDANGEFAVFYNEDPDVDDIGWFWKPAYGYAEGPYDTSKEAHDAAVNLNFSHNHEG